MTFFDYPPGATPIDRNEAAGLKLKYITMQSELNAAEQENIVKAQTWLATRKRVEPLLEKFVRDLHKRMFSDVWKWAGTFRQTDKNIGAAWSHVPTKLQEVLQDARYWIEHSTYDWDELGARFHHRLVSVHCFANGNGRHARLATDVLLRSHGKSVFSWGAASNSAETRDRYLSALRAADKNRHHALIEFVRS